jgi:hypothetical protein
MLTRSVTAELRMVPNQPLTFAGQTDPRTEDGIIAYSWDKYLRTGDETWPLRLPMTKSAVRAMDAITGFCRSRAGGAVEIGKFVLAGASKRGWTAWTAAAVDRRVAAVVPVVIDLLNIEASFEHHYRAYGFWAPSIAAYQASGIMRWAGTAELGSLLEIEDPFAYRDRLIMPKFVINSAGDQYFLPDSSRFYFGALIGEKYLRYVPNTDHSLKGSDVRESVLAFYHAIVAGQPRPTFSWSFARWRNRGEDCDAAARGHTMAGGKSRDARLPARDNRACLPAHDPGSQWRRYIHGASVRAGEWLGRLFYRIDLCERRSLSVQINHRSAGRTRDAPLRPAARNDRRLEKAG